MNAKTLLEMTKQTGKAWVEDNASRLAASLAFYTLLSIAPLLVLLVSMLGLVFGEEAARGEIAGQLTAAFGYEASRGIEELIAAARVPSQGALGTLFGVVVLLLGASGVFGELQASLNTVWEVESKPGQGVLGFIKARFFSFTMVLGVGFLLLVSLVVSTLLSALGGAITPDAPGLSVLVQVLSALVSFAFVTVLFALMYRVIPDVRIAWRDVFMGAAVTALLFTIGKFLLGLYLGRASVASPYGAAGSLVVFVLWVYYSAQILFLGAEFTQVYATTLGSRIVPDEHAVALGSARVTPPDQVSPSAPGAEPSVSSASRRS